MDGSSLEIVVSNGLVNPTDLTIDKVGNTLYWVDGDDSVHYIVLNTREKNVSVKICVFDLYCRP